MSYATDLPGGVGNRAHKTAPTWEMDDSKVEASDSWIVPASDLPEFMRVVAGASEPIGAAPWSLRWVPLRFIEDSSCIAHSVRARWIGWDRTGTDANTGLPGTRTHAKVDIKYKTPDYLLSGPDAMIRLDFNSQTWPMMVPAGALPLGDGVTPMATSIPAGGQILNYEVLNVVNFDPADWVNRSGISNLYEWRHYPPGCIFFPGLGGRQINRFGTASTWNLHTPFHVRSVPWNLEYGEDGELGLVTKPDGSPLFTPVDFLDVFGF